MLAELCIADRLFTAAGSQDADEMSNLRIRLVVTRLLSDEVLWLRFGLDRVKVLCELQAQGFGLTPSEIDLFMLSDAEMW